MMTSKNVNDDVGSINYDVIDIFQFTADLDTGCMVHN